MSQKLKASAKIVLKEEGLSSGEIRIVEQLLQCDCQKAIAENMGVVVSTVKFHLSNIFRKLMVHRTHGLIHYLIRNKMLEDFEAPVAEVIPESPPEPKFLSDGTILLPRGNPVIIEQA